MSESDWTEGLAEALSELDAIDLAVLYYAIAGPMPPNLESALQKDAFPAQHRTFNRIHRAVTSLPFQLFPQEVRERIHAESLSPSTAGED